MAEEGLVERLFGGELSGESEAAESVTQGLDAAAAAAAMRAAETDPRLEAQAAAYFSRQSRFIDLQTEDLLEQRGETRWRMHVRRWREGLQLSFQLLLAVVALVIGLGVAVMLYDAFSSRSVVVSAFKSPPALSARGLSGDVVAASVLDALQKLQDATRGPSKGLSTRGAWAGDVKIEVPQTGVSIGEMSRLLHERLGHDVHIDGDLVQRPDGGLALTIRGDDIPAKTFIGPVENIEQLTTQAAEYVYGRSQAWQYAVYLANTGSRNADAIAFGVGALNRARTDDDRAGLANVIGNAYSGDGDHIHALHYHQLSRSYAKPLSAAWWKAWGNTLNDLGGPDTSEQASVSEALAYLRAVDAAPADQKPEARFLGGPARILNDAPLSLRAALDEAGRNGGRGANTSLAGGIVAGAYVAMHDDVAAERTLASSDADDPLARAVSANEVLQGALERGDFPAAASAGERYWAIVTKEQHVKPGQDSTLCELAYVYALAGRAAEAKATFEKAGVWSECYGRRGVLLAKSGDLTGARKLWDEGVARAPDAPYVYLRRGEWERDQGDFAAAGSDLSLASAKSPHWAEPWKAWGDLQAKQSRWKDALTKYDEALKYAPNWNALKVARAKAAQG